MQFQAGRNENLSVSGLSVAPGVSLARRLMPISGGATTTRVTAQGTRQNPPATVADVTQAVTTLSALRPGFPAGLSADRRPGLRGNCLAEPLLRAAEGRRGRLPKAVISIFLAGGLLRIPKLRSAGRAIEVGHGVPTSTKPGHFAGSFMTNFTAF